MNGILVYQQIRALVDEGFLVSNPSISPAQIQPSSLDLRLATRGYRVRSGFLPEHCRVSVARRGADDKKVRVFNVDLRMRMA